MQVKMPKMRKELRTGTMEWDSAVMICGGAAQLRIFIIKNQKTKLCCNSLKKHIMAASNVV
jgi:hypothetical protein